MRIIVVDELLNGVIHPIGHYTLIDNSTGFDTFAFGLCLLTRRFASAPLPFVSDTVGRHSYVQFQLGEMI